MDANKIERIKGNVGRFAKVRNTSAERSGAAHLFEGGRVRVDSEFLLSYGIPAAVVLCVSDPKGNVPGERHLFRIDSSRATSGHIGEFFEEAIGRSRKDTAKARAEESRRAGQDFPSPLRLGLESIFSTLCFHRDESEILRNIVDAFMVKVEAVEIYEACQAPTAARRLASL